MKSSIAVGAILAIALLTIVRADAADQPAAPIPLQEIRERGIEGRLGVRLGTIVRISGTVVANRSRNKRDMGEPYFLKIDAIDGRDLEEPVLYAYRKHGFAELEPPKIGDKFRYVAYEDGAFRGAVDGEEKYILPYADVGFGFETEIQVLAAE
jgi:hypothetical protein